MNRLLNPMKFLATLVLLAFAVGCATTQQTQQTENLLSEAGFKTVIASTPKQQQRLNTLEPDKITPVKRQGKTLFVFPDPAHNPLYVGGQAEHQKYLQLRSQQKLSNENLIAAEVSEHEDKMLKRMLAGWD
jgi:long-subunit acyl-CoA synthetase (AMP-forming)